MKHKFKVGDRVRFANISMNNNVDFYRRIVGRTYIVKEYYINHNGEQYISLENGPGISKHRKFFVTRFELTNNIKTVLPLP